MNQNIRNLLGFCLGIILAITLLVIGVLLTNVLEHGFWALLSVILIPVSGLIFFLSKKKYIGFGLFFSAIPIVILTFLFIQISKLH